MVSLLLLVLVAGPLVAVAMSLAGDTRQMIQPLLDMAHSTLPAAPSWVDSIPLAGSYLHQQWSIWQAKGPDWFLDVKPALHSAGGYLLIHSRVVGEILVQSLMAIVFAFWFHIQGEQITKVLHDALSYIVGPSSRSYWTVAQNTIQGVINGVIGTAIIQAVLLSIGFAIAGVPGVLLLGVATFFLSLIPMGPPLLYVPASIWLISSGHTALGVFLLIWGFVIVGGADHILKPVLISRGGVLPMPIVLLGVLGGMIVWGFLGLFLGPVFLALAFTLVREWLARRSASATYASSAAVEATD
jgi:predicted PurR-regulated permease PerM